MKVNILGTDYEIIYENFGRDDRDGFVSIDNKTIHIDSQITSKVRKEIALKHEIVHAFFFESGLEEYFYDEKLISWVAIQFNKIKNVFEEVLDKDE